jgi:hypothetical protein
LTITLFPYYLLKMPSSPPGPPSPDANTGPANKPESDNTDTAKAAGVLSIVAGVFGFLFMVIWHYGAASLSYAKYGSIGWAILDFFFATFYYPYYALVLNTPTPTMMGGRRKLKLW